MEIQFNLKTSTDKLRSSAFFKALEQCGQSENQHVIQGNIDKYGYLFSSQEIDFEQILEYWDLATYYDLKIDDLRKKIMEHMNTKMNRSLWQIQQLIEIHTRSFGSISIDPLFKNTNNMGEIYTELKTNAETQHIAFIFNDKFNKWSTTYDNLFNVFDIISDKQRYGISEFLHKLVPDKSSFAQKFNTLTCDLIDDKFDWKNVVCAGGMILESLSVCELNKFTDIDLFLYGSQQEQIEKVDQLCDYFLNRAKELSSVAWFGSLSAGRNRSVITICFESIERTVQIISTVETQMESIIANFDIYCNSVLYDGQRVMGLKQWFNAVETKITELNPSHRLKNKRLYKTVKKGFQFDKDYHLSDSYKRYVESGEAAKELESHYYYLPKLCDFSESEIDAIMLKLSKIYHADSFSREIPHVDELKGIDPNAYFDSLDNIHHIKKEDIRLHNTGGQIIDLSVSNGDEEDEIYFTTDWYPCESVHEKDCTGCLKSESEPMFHLYYNRESTISVDEKFNQEFKHIRDLITPLLRDDNINIPNNLDANNTKRQIKFSRNAKIILNDEETTIEDMHNLYKNGIDTTSPLPLVRLKCHVKSYFNGFFTVRCVCAEFQYD